MNDTTSVYILSCEGRVKIGIAANVKARVIDLQMHCPLPITIEHERQFADRDTARRVERSLHLKFGEQRIHGEWFVMAAETAGRALSEAIPEEAAPVWIPGRLKSRRDPPAPYVRKKPDPEPRKPRAAAWGDGPSWEEYEAMDEATWLDFMRPAAATLDFTNPHYRETVDRLQAELRVKYPQYFGRATALQE